MNVKYIVKENVEKMCSLHFRTLITTLTHGMLFYCLINNEKNRMPDSSIGKNERRTISGLRNAIALEYKEINSGFRLTVVRSFQNNQLQICPLRHFSYLSSPLSIEQ